MLSSGLILEQDRPMPSYDAELTALHDLISHAVSVLLADNINSVKQALMEHSVTKLAVFFGKQKANDVILSHMITFLNDKEDSQLRLAFYDNIVGVAAFVGWQCSPILLPLLQQGLSDPEEFVIARCINTMASLTGTYIFNQKKKRPGYIIQMYHGFQSPNKRAKKGGKFKTNNFFQFIVFHA